MTPEPDTQTAEETDARHAAKMAKKKAARDKIMRDSRIGTYGVCALILSFGLRWSALAAIANPWLVTLALCAAHCAARAGVPAFMQAPANGKFKCNSSIRRINTRSAAETGRGR